MYPSGGVTVRTGGVGDACIWIYQTRFRVQGPTTTSVVGHLAFKVRVDGW